MGTSNFNKIAGWSDLVTPPIRNVSQWRFLQKIIGALKLRLHEKISYGIFLLSSWFRNN